MFCTKCGKLIPARSSVCAWCGAAAQNQTNSAYTQPDGNRQDFNEWFNQNSQQRYQQPNSQTYQPYPKSPKVKWYKKPLGKVLSGVMAVFVGFTLIGAFSPEDNTAKAYNSSVSQTEPVKESDEEINDNTGYTGKPNFSSDFPASDDSSFCYYGKQLTEKGKYFYLQLYQYYIVQGQTGDCQLYLPETFSVTVDCWEINNGNGADKSTKYDSATVSDAADKDFRNALEKAASAFNLDFVKLNWWRDYYTTWDNEWDYVFEWDNDASEMKTGKITCSLEHLTLHPEESYTGAIDDINPLNRELNEWRADISARAGENADRFMLVKTIHDYLCEQVSYSYDKNGDPDTSGSNGWASGAILKGKVVCSGYSKTFRLLCEQFNVPCVYIRGYCGERDKNGNYTVDTEARHAWNMVQMENGLWYGLDATWDDDDSIDYSYFLRGSNKKITDCTFFEEHVSREEFEVPEPAFYDYR